MGTCVLFFRDSFHEAAVLLRSLLSFLQCLQSLCILHFAFCILAVVQARAVLLLNLIKNRVLGTNCLVLVVDPHVCLLRVCEYTDVYTAFGIVHECWSIALDVIWSMLVDQVIFFL
jgi:hypothetical protein